MGIGFFALLVRAAATLLVFAAPGALLGEVLFGWRGAAVGAAVGVLAFGLLLLVADQGVERALGAAPKVSVSFLRTYERAMLAIGRSLDRAPRVLFFADTGPRLIYARAPLGSGVILLSQGLFSLLDEDELRAVLQEATRRLDRSGISFQSLCLWAAISFSRMGSLLWTESLVLGFGSDQATLDPRSGLQFAFAYPWIRFFLRLGRASRPASKDLPEELEAALRKMELNRRLHGAGRNPAAGLAGLVNLSLQR